MEGIAYLERMGIEVLEALGLPHSQVTYATGGATRNELWLRIRATITGRAMLLTENPESAFGAAILAAVPRFGSCRAAQEKMVRIHKRIEPEQRLTSCYEEGYAAFRAELAARGYTH
jgi:sugar (pentulose or hexulose) kinase